jgi:phosphatidylglycerophosphatase A
MPGRPRNTLALIVATGFGAGYVPVAPGTAGSAVALPLAWLAFRYGGFPGVVAAAVVMTLVGIWASSHAEAHYGEHDCQRIVVDEIAGQLISVIAVSCTWPNLIVAFGWFRLFDSVKPWPAGRIDAQMPGGLGVMLDDVAAGVYAAAATALLVHLGLVDAAVRWLARLVGIG